MDFLFASQDASTSSLVWLVALMADHPNVLAKVCSLLLSNIYISLIPQSLHDLKKDHIVQTIPSVAFDNSVSFLANCRLGLWYFFDRIFFWEGCPLFSLDSMGSVRQSWSPTDQPGAESNQSYCLQTMSRLVKISSCMFLLRSIIESWDCMFSARLKKAQGIRHALLQQPYHITDLSVF